MAMTTGERRMAKLRRDVAAGRRRTAPSGPPITTRRVRVDRHVSRAEAMRQALIKSPGDFRGFTYDPSTGEATLT